MLVYGDASKTFVYPMLAGVNDTYKGRVVVKTDVTDWDGETLSSDQRKKKIGQI